MYPTATALDAGGNWYITVQTHIFAGGTGIVQYPGITSTGYQTTSLAHNSTNGAIADSNNVAAISKFSNDGHTLLYGSFLEDTYYGVPVLPTSMAVGQNGIVFVGGYTDATTFPTTPGVIKTACTQANGYDCTTQDGFITAFDTTKSAAPRSCTPPASAART